MSAGAVSLRAPRRGESAVLTALCLRSKAHWGYDEAFMAACRAELALDEAALSSGLVRVAESGGAPAGVVELGFEDGRAVLEKLFVEPRLMGRGVGRRLLGWAVDRARDHGCATMTIDADPDAAGFYRRHGAADAGMAPSGSIPGRFLPRLEIALDREAPGNPGVSGPSGG